MHEYLAAGESGDGPLSRGGGRRPPMWPGLSQVFARRPIGKRGTPAGCTEKRDRRRSAHARRRRARRGRRRSRFASSLALGSRFCECMALSIERGSTPTQPRARDWRAYWARRVADHGFGSERRNRTSRRRPAALAETLGHLKSLHAASADGGRWPPFPRERPASATHQRSRQSGRRPITTGR